MKQTKESAILYVKPTQPWYGCALACVTIGALFSLVSLGWIAHTRLAIGRETVKAEQLLLMKEQVAEAPDREAQLAQIRLMDQQIREARLYYLEISRRSGWMLLVGVAVTLLAYKWLRVCRKGLPNPLPVTDVGVLQRREATLTRWAVAGGVTLLVCTACVLAVTERVTLVAEMTTISLPAVVSPPSYAAPAELAQNWHRFRGIEGAGVTDLKTIPAQWDGASGEGILWKSEIPLAGHNSPVVWQDRIFLSGGNNETLQVFCYEAKAGKLLWTGTVPTDKAMLKELEVMEDTGMAACTMATDGARVYAIFASGDLICFDLEGKRLWHHHLGVPESVYGFATSLEVYRDRVLVQFDQAYADEGMSYIAAYEGPTGKLAWKTMRPVSNGWTSPIVAKVGESDQLITVGAPLTIGYDPATGKELWRAECVDGDVAPSPVVAEGMVFAIEPYSQMVAVRLDGQGDVTETHIAWRNEDGGPDICSPVTASGLIYLLDSQGELACFKVSDGSELFRHDLDEMFNASPSIVNNTLYLLDAEGIMHMTPVSPEAPKEVRTAALGEKCFATPAFVDGRIYIRGEAHLWCIGKE